MTEPMTTCSFTAPAHSKTMSIELDIDLCVTTPIRCSAFEKKELFASLCENGCINYGRKWSCPPNSPSFSSFALKYNFLYVIYMRAYLADFLHIKNDYLKIKAANSMLKSRADRFARALAHEYGAFVLTGSCRLCKPCRFQFNEPCAHPAQMGFSFESLGIDVNELVKALFNLPLLWYSKGNLPMYTSVVCGLLSDCCLGFDYLKSRYFEVVTD